MASQNLQIQKLAGRENYATCRFAVKTYLEHEELWEYVDPKKTATDDKKDIKAKSKIILLVDPINYVHIETAETARQVWTNLQTISWSSRRQLTVALSTTEAEYMSLSSCVQEAMWLKQFQEDLWPMLRNEALVINSDNQSSIKLSGTDGYHSRTKHIDVRHHFVRDKVHEGAIDVRYVQTDLMVADTLTKATSLPKLAFYSKMMGLCLREDVEIV